MQNSSVFQFLALDTIHEAASSPRRTFDDSRLHELAEFPGTVVESARILFVFNALEFLRGDQ